MPMLLVEGLRFNEREALDGDRFELGFPLLLLRISSREGKGEVESVEMRRGAMRLD